MRMKFYEAFMDELDKIASKGKLSKRLIKLSPKSLKRLSPRAEAVRKSGDTPIILTGENTMYRGKYIPKGVAGVRGTVKESVTSNVRNALRKQKKDKLATKKPGSVLKDQERKRAPYW